MIFRRLQSERQRIVMGDGLATSSATLLIVLILGTTATIEQPCRTIKSISNRALAGHVIGVSASSSVEKCHVKCEREPDCYSINYMLSSKTCELNKGTRLSHPNQFLPRENAVYLDSLHRRYHACVHPPCQNGGTCIILPRSPGYNCNCQPKYSGDDCQVCNGDALGMKDKLIPNSAIFASSFEPDSPPSSGRIYSSGGWRALSNDTSPYLEIRFRSEKLLTAVATQGCVDPKKVAPDCWTVKYFLEYKTNGTRWTVHKEDRQDRARREFIGNSNAEGNMKNRINKPFRCNTVRIRPITWVERPCMRSEVYGCDAFK